MQTIRAEEQPLVPGQFQRAQNLGFDLPLDSDGARDYVLAVGPAGFFRGDKTSFGSLGNKRVICRQLSGGALTKQVGTGIADVHYPMTARSRLDERRNERRAHPAEAQCSILAAEIEDSSVRTLDSV